MDSNNLNGNTPILSYSLSCIRKQIDILTESETGSNLQLDDIVLPSSLSKTYINPTDTFRYDYYCKYFATNVHGQGPFSDEQKVECASAPDEMNVTTLTTFSEKLQILFTLPNNNGKIITSVKIKIRSKDLAYHEITCENTISLFSECEVSMLVLIAPPFSLNYLDPIYAKAQATNAIGVGNEPLLGVSGTAVINTVPSKPQNIPVITNPSETGFTITITPINTSPDNGGLPITNYYVEYRESNANTWNKIDIGTNTQIIINSNIIPNALHIFRYTSKNLVGESDFSDENQAYATGIPTVSSISVSTRRNIVTVIINYSSVFSVFEEELRYGDGILIKCPKSLVTTNYSICEFDYSTQFKGINSTTFTVRGKNVSGFSNIATSTQIRFNNNANYPPTISQGIAIQTATSTKINLLMPLVTGAKYYFLYRKDENSDKIVRQCQSLLPNCRFYEDKSITPGQTYQYYFKVLGYSGMSPKSETISVLAAESPKSILPPNLSYSANKDYIVITWQPPLVSGGLQLQYFVTLQTSNANHPLIGCQGIGGLSCQVLMSDLWIFGLKYPDTISVIIRAQNPLGYTSSQSGQIKVLSSPSKPEQPLNVFTSSNEIIIKALPQSDPANGGSEITIYTITCAQCTIPTNNITAGQEITYSVIAGQTYSFSLATTNNFGTSIHSNALTVLAASVPEKITKPTITIVDGGLKISIHFSDPNGNGLNISKYQIQFIKDSNAISIFESSTYNASYIFTMADLKNNYNLVQSDIIIVKVRAYNALGFGILSDPSTENFLIQGIPSKPTLPIVTGILNYNTAQIVIPDYMDSNNLNGNTPILSYSLSCIRKQIDILTESETGSNLQLDDIVLPSSLSKTYINPTDTFRYDYYCKYFATNVHGQGPFSDEQKVECASAPDEMNVTTLTTFSEKLQILFTLPNNNGKIITSVKIKIRSKDLAYHEITCENTISLFSECEVSMLVLIAPPFSLNYLDPIYAKAQATNAIGVGNEPLLGVSGTAVINTVPSKPQNIPVITNPSETGFTITITPINTSPDNGGLPITNYYVEYRESNANTWNKIDIGTNTQIIINSNIIPNALHIFRYTSKNLVGESDFSDENQAYATGIPTVSSISVSTRRNIVTVIINYSSVFSVFEEELRYGDGILIKCPKSLVTTNYSICKKD